MMKFRQEQASHKHRRYRIRQQWVPLSRISPYLQKAVLIAEDDTFYEHRGVDFQEMLDSLKDNWKRKYYARGGSTITQQVAKNLFLSPRKFLLRKLKEMVLAFRLERALGKKRILEIYLNIAEWGPGIFGAETAAREYFGKSAAEVSLEEAVALAAVLPSPLRHSPVQEGRYLKWRKEMIMSRLERWGNLPESAFALRENEPDWVTDEETGDEPPVVSEVPAEHEAKPEDLDKGTSLTAAVRETPSLEDAAKNIEGTSGGVAVQLSSTAY
jgi:monofunctional biosynthetic peptidoglycan transglycosylase